ncbi:MAG: flavin reductase family protein [Alphaproteobacteria bacterium]|nr:flavin reductase family protein [Alphaproteobacteria bacterium]
MFYETEKNNHGLKYNPYKSIVIPRPIGWISTISHDGIVNLAPFSQFNNLGYDPPYVMFSASTHPDGARNKDSVHNAQMTGEFVVNMATYELREAVSKSSYYLPPEVDEFDYAGLEKAPSVLVKPPRVAASPIHLECVFHQTVVLPGYSINNICNVVIGRVVGVHIRDDVLTADGRIDVLKVRPIARLGYHDYTSVDSIFTMKIDETAFSEQLKAGLGGEAKGKRPRQAAE